MSVICTTANTIAVTMNGTLNIINIFSYSFISGLSFGSYCTLTNRYALVCINCVPKLFFTLNTS